MRYVGIDVASETHTVAAVTEADEVVLKPSPFAEDAGGYERLFEKLGSAEDALVAMEATGHYWKNLFAALVARGFAVALLNPLRTRRFAEENEVFVHTHVSAAAPCGEKKNSARAPASILDGNVMDRARSRRPPFRAGRRCGCWYPPSLRSVSKHS